MTSRDLPRGGEPRPEADAFRASQSSAPIELRDIIAGDIHPIYQPIVDLDRGGVVGYEALARGPGGSSLESPVALFGAARAQGLLADLDRACVLAACRGAERAGLTAPASLFINVEPEVIDAHFDDGRLEFLGSLPQRLDVFFEVTERSLATRPAELLETVGRLRAAGFGIALDDLGVERCSLALLPLLRPDIVKLDMSLIHEHPSRRSGEVLNGVWAYAESTGSVVLAEGIETAAHLKAARTMGASLAQGWYFGHPGPLPSAPAPVAGATVNPGLPARPVPLSPIELVRRHRRPKIGTKDMLLSVTRALEAQAFDLGQHAVVVAAFQDAEYFTGRSRQQYEQLGASTGLTVALGEGFSEAPVPGVRAATLAPEDPLRQEWDIAVLGPHYAGALVARDLGDDGPEADRRFEFVLTFDRDLVVDVATSLISRLAANPREPRQLIA